MKKVFGKLSLARGHTGRICGPSLPEHGWVIVPGCDLRCAELSPFAAAEKIQSQVIWSSHPDPEIVEPTTTCDLSSRWPVRLDPPCRSSGSESELKSRLSLQVSPTRRDTRATFGSCVVTFFS